MVVVGVGSAQVWVGWAFDSATTNVGNVWAEWADSYTSATSVSYNVLSGTEAAQRGPTQEEPDAMQARIAQSAEADARAEELLLSLLDEDQREEYSEKRQISIFCGGEHPAFILRKVESFNIVELDICGEPVSCHCVQTVGVPLADQLATQFLYIASGHHQELLAVANHHPVNSVGMLTVVQES
jgi:hypothetical protein